MSDNPIDEIRALIARLNKIAGGIGLELDQAAVIPATEHGVDILQAVFLIKPDAVREEDPLQEQFDEQFAEIEKNLNLEIQTDKTNEAREKAAEELKDWFD